MSYLTDCLSFGQLLYAFFWSQLHLATRNHDAANDVRGPKSVESQIRLHPRARSIYDNAHTCAICCGSIGDWRTSGRCGSTMHAELSQPQKKRKEDSLTAVEGVAGAVPRLPVLEGGCAGHQQGHGAEDAHHGGRDRAGIHRARLLVRCAPAHPGSQETSAALLERASPAVPQSA